MNVSRSIHARLPTTGCRLYAMAFPEKKKPRLGRGFGLDTSRHHKDPASAPVSCYGMMQPLVRRHCM